MSEACCNTFSPMQQGADDAVDAVDDEDAQEVGHGHDDEAQGADDDGDERPDVTIWMPLCWRRASCSWRSRSS